MARPSTFAAVFMGDLVMKKVIAEFIGTFALVFIGCGTGVVGGMATGSTAITELAIALAFGLSIVAMAYGIGQISGCQSSGELRGLDRRKNVT